MPIFMVALIGALHSEVEGRGLRILKGKTPSGGTLHLSPSTRLPTTSDLFREQLGRPHRVQQYHLPVQLVPEPGLLALGVLPGRDGHRVGHALPAPLAEEVLDRLLEPYAV